MNMLAETIARQGNWFFRWRSYVLLAFVPLGLYAISYPEPIEMFFGDTADQAWEIGCILIAFLGLGIRAMVVGQTPAGTSGRNTHGQVAEVLNTTGLYSVTRNPLYLGNAIIYMAIALFTQSVMFALVMGLFLILYLERIIAAEETFLAQKFGAPYKDWTARTPVFLPDFSLWRKATLPFSIRNVLKREYSGFFAIIAAVTLIDYAHEAFGEGETIIGLAWAAFFMAGAVIYVTLRGLKKHSSVLQVEGR
jgi:protein-S-isoprenylcysteine O-methyltransferase Ste14